jgi:RadC-like JAB domain
MHARYDDRTPPAYRCTIALHPIAADRRTVCSMSIKDGPVNQRPREKLLTNGAHSLSDAELRAVLLGASGRRGQDAVAMARELLRRHQCLRAGPPLDSPQATRDFLIRRLRDAPHELFRGTIDGASVRPREVVKQALFRNAAAVILAHNHPLCCVASVTTGSSVTRFETRAGRGTGQHR